MQITAETEQACQSGVCSVQWQCSRGYVSESSVSHSSTVNYLTIMHFCGFGWLFGV